MSVIEIYKDSNKEYRFRFVASNNEIVATSEGYKRKRKCYQGIKAVILISNNAPIKDLTKHGNSVH